MTTQIHTAKDVASATDLNSLNQMLTQSMAQQKIHEIIKADELAVVCNAIVKLAKGKQPLDQLKAAGMLERLAAVARGREQLPRELLVDILSERPPSIDSLGDEKEKSYAASAVRYANGGWVEEYCALESLSIDAADNARKELLAILLDRLGTVSSWLIAIREHSSVLDEIDNQDSRLKRVRRILTQMRAVARDYQGDLGQHWGKMLSELSKTLIRRSEQHDVDVLHDVLNGFLGLLTRAIELRFSVALEHESYTVLDELRKRVGGLGWGRFLSDSGEVHSIRRSLLEAALVIARQTKTDSEIMEAIQSVYTSRPQAAAAMKRHFDSAHDLDPDTRGWWIKCGAVSGSERTVQQAIGTGEDQQIGALLIEVEANQDAMDKLLRVVAPLLEISDAVLASTVRKAATGYSIAAQISRRLARMRHLSKTDLKNEILEYNPLEHEMVGGHRLGVRRVKVVRDGIKKDFGGKIKTLVKPWVEPVE